VHNPFNNIMSVGKEPPPKKEKVFKDSLKSGIKSTKVTMGKLVVFGYFFSKYSSHFSSLPVTRFF
jgi:hypothetical protein